MSQTIYDFTAADSRSMVYEFKKLEGKTLLIVNTASKCGFTPQYDGLQKLHEKYADKGLVVIGFPCDQFAHQEPGTDAEIAEFCRTNFGVTFPIMKKVDVNGSNADPVFKFLRSRSSGFFGSSVKWNFTKFLVAKDGKTVKRYAPTVEPASITKDLEAMLAG